MKKIQRGFKFFQKHRSMIIISGLVAKVVIIEKVHQEFLNHLTW